MLIFLVFKKWYMLKNDNFVIIYMHTYVYMYIIYNVCIMLLFL